MLGGGLLMAGAAGPDITYVGSITKAFDLGGYTYSAYYEWDDSPIDVTTIASVGDLVVMAVSFEIYDQAESFTGLTWTQIADTTSGGSTPFLWVGYGILQAGDSGSIKPDLYNGFWNAPTVVISVFSLGGASVNSVSSASASALGTGFNPPSLTATGALWLATLHIKRDDVATVTPPSGYTLAGEASITNTGYGTASGSSTAIAYKIADQSSDDPGAFSDSGGASDDWVAYTIAFDIS